MFERPRKAVTLTPAGKSFLIDARQILEDCDASIRKTQRTSRGKLPLQELDVPITNLPHTVKQCRFIEMSMGEPKRTGLPYSRKNDSNQRNHPKR